MTKLKEKDFQTFKKWVEHYTKQYELSEYEIMYEFKDIGTTRNATCSLSSHGMVTYALNIEIDVDFKGKTKDNELKNIAQHEVLHCLLYRFSNRAVDRFTLERELVEEEERLVRKLQSILN